jgi:predicted 3-demethylubiquinone-9 3-methyltransferase (glyoxalase superfamily)
MGITKHIRGVMRRLDTRRAKAVLMSAVLALSTLLNAVSPMAAYAAETTAAPDTITVTGYNAFSNSSGMWNSHVQAHYATDENGNDLYCGNFNLHYPGEGTTIGRSHAGGLTLDYILYYGYGGAGYAASSDGLYGYYGENARAITQIAVWCATNGRNAENSPYGAGSGYANVMFTSQGQQFYDDAVRNATGSGPYAGTAWVYDNGSDQPLIGQVVRLGHLNLHKESSDPAGTSGNPNYSLAGATYGVYSDAGCTSRVATLTTGADGWTNTVDLYSGTYYVREDGASTGFAVCTDTHTVTVTVGQTVTAHCTEQMVPGHVNLKKTSANPSLTEGNGCYSLAGATYAVYSDAACTTQVGTLTTGADGSTNTIDVPAGTYYVRETQASKGYYLCTETHSVTVGVGQTGTISCTEWPSSDPIRMVVGKYDGEKNYKSTNLPTGSAALNDAEFTVDYYDTVDYDNYDALKSANAKPARSWTFKTNTSGIAHFNASDFVAGSAFYYDSNGNPCIPRGTVVIRETKAPKGYNLSTDVSFQKIQESTLQGVTTFNTPEVPEQVYRSDIEFTKRAENGSDRLANVAFKVTSLTTGESHVVVTDENGYFSSAASWNAHTATANGNDWAASADGTIDSSRLDSTVGTWFGQDTSPADSKGAFPYDTYSIEELRCTSNEGYALVSTTFTVSRDAKVIDLGTLDDPQPEIHTTAYDAADGDGYLAVGNVTVADRVSYSHVVAGRDYRLVAELHDSKTGDAITGEDGQPVTAEQTFTAGASYGSTVVEIPLTTYDLIGKTVTVYETLYDAQGSRLVTHADKGDVAQQVTVVTPSIGTTATDAVDGDKCVVSEDDASVVDTVSYSNLTPGETYKVTGTLYKRVTDDEGNVTEERFQVNGQDVTAEAEFVAEQADGTVTVTFGFDASALDDGTKLVAFEDCTSNGHEICSHADISDEGQTVTIVRPEIGTTAYDSADGDKNVVSEDDAAVKDTIAYKNLSAGKAYKVTGTLYKKVTDDEGNVTEEKFQVNGQDVTAEAEFTAEAPEGTVEVTFNFDATGLDDNTELVAFERLSRNGVELAAHADINDEGQTVTVTKPEVGTTATDGFDGDKNVVADTDATVTDTVDYKNLTPGKTYKVTGTLYKKVTDEAGNVSEEKFQVNGQDVTAEAEFVAEQADGTVEVTFHFDGSRLPAGTPLVAFESLSHNGVELAAHADINDEEQTVTVIVPDVTTLAADGLDGDKEVVADSESSVTDTAWYSSVLTGKDYTMAGILMDKATGLPVVTGNADGAITDDDLKAFAKDLLATLGLKADAPEGTDGVTMPDDAKDNGDAATDGTESAENAAFDWSAMSELPATPVSQDDLAAFAERNADVLSHVVYATQEFTPEEASGTLKMEYPFDSNDVIDRLTGETKDVVVFEVLLKGSLSDKEGTATVVASECDAQNEDQTIKLVPSTIGTTAVDKSDGDHELLAGKDAVITDTVSYKGLIPGKEYTLKATLMDKATSEPLKVADKGVTAELRFTPNSADGTIDIDLGEFDATGLAGHTLVVFEELYKQSLISDVTSDEAKPTDVKVAEHKDINDEGQSVTVTETPKGTTYGHTGNGIQTVVLAILAGMTLAGCCAAYGIRAKRSKSDPESGDGSEE